VGEAEEIPLFFTFIPILALLGNHDRENCLIYVDTEGSKQVSAVWRKAWLESSHRVNCVHWKAR